jgi:glucose-6-phosphate 1-dehydrogenase
MVRPHCFEECTFIIFGITGDLSSRKLLPAIYKLIEDKKLCRFAIIGLSFDSIETKDLLKKSKKFIQKSNPKIWNKLEKHFYYYQMDFYDKFAYPKLKNLLEEVENRHKLPSNRIFYLATMPDHFVAITKLISKNEIARKEVQTKNPWHRVVYEKPFGKSLKTFKKTLCSVKKVFCEDQIFRIDHYLGKELVGNIALSRFTNKIFEPLWNSKHIEEVQIVLSELVGVEGRGASYDLYGATKDMFQSHILQLLAFIAMEQPKKLTAQHIRDAKAVALKKVFVDTAIKGQYVDYTKEPLVCSKSKTDTFVAVKLFINNKRWKDVPFYLKTGKYLGKKSSSIYIKFKEVPCLLISCPSQSNYLMIKIDSDGGLTLGLNVKVPGIAYEVTPITMDFCHSSLFGPNTPEAYETLLSDVIKGDHSAFVRSDEVEISWKITEQVEKKAKKLFTYTRESSGPKEIENLNPEKKIDWHA